MDDKFSQVVEKFQKLNGITKKASERIVVDLINNSEKLASIEEAVLIIKNDISECPICFYLRIDGKCLFCDDQTRDQNLIAVVSTILDAKTIEDSKAFNGVYAVLKGEINLSKNITPDKLKIRELFERVNSNTELILALNLTFNGELTANYIRDLARQKKINYTRLARGIPSGGVLDYVDEKTLSSAFKNRKKED